MPIESQLAEHRGYLLRFARLQLRNDTWAEDAVSETLLAALAKPQSFGNRSQLKTWLVGILKHKVIDVLRQRQREVPLSDGDGSEEEALEALQFKADDHYAVQPADWGDPEQDLSSRQFMQILEACTDKLPPAMGRVFLMREWLARVPEDERADLFREISRLINEERHEAEFALSVKATLVVGQKDHSH